MAETLQVTISGWESGQPIPETFAFGVPGTEGPMDFGQNLSPAIRWSGAPAGTKSYAIICHDPDVPSKVDDVNQEGRTVPKDLPRVDFYHWVLVDVPASLSGLGEGADSNKVTPGGKDPGPTDHGKRGINNYTQFLAGMEGMAGEYAGYDGPCPPWNDELVHRYIFTVYALDVPSLDLPEKFDGPAAVEAMQGHILAQGTYEGTYTLNKALRG
jgi:hypothetical protein